MNVHECRRLPHTLATVPNRHVSFAETPDIETSSEEYASRFAGEIGRYFLNVQTRAVLDLLKPFPRASVLDVGGGHGQIALPLVRHGFNVTVTGSSRNCKDRLDLVLPTLSFQFVCSSFFALPFEDKQFDVVMAFRLLAHAHHWSRLIGEMCRVASKAVIVDYPDLCSFNILSEQFFRAKRAIETNTRPFLCFRRKTLVKEFISHGFRQPAIRRQFFVPMAIHRALARVHVSKTLEIFSRFLGMTYFFGSPVILRVTAKT